MAPTQPSALTWTILFKNRKSTTLLHVDPTDSFSNIKAELLRALRNIHPDGVLHGNLKIPSSAKDILIARHISSVDASSSWERIYDSAADMPIKDEKPTGKKSAATEDTPKGAGLADGAWVAYKFATEGEHDEDLEDETWDVVIPTYDDVPALSEEGNGAGVNGDMK